jgi:uncharacterized delta-60 repeat protein
VTPVNGSYHFPTALTEGAPYLVEVVTQPGNPPQSCTLVNPTGSVTTADVTNIQVTCQSLASSGSLDPTFGTNGLAVTNIPYATDVFDSRMGMALQADGKVLLVGGTTLVRLPFDGGIYDGALDVAVQASGKIVVVGVTDPNEAIGKDDFALARFNADGSLDTTFGAGGKVSTDIAGSTDMARRVLLQPDGKILVAGYAIVVVTPTLALRDFALARYTEDGAPDTTFTRNGTGKTHNGYSVNFSEARGLALQSDGRITLAGIAADDGVNSAHQAGVARIWGDVHPGNAFTGDLDDSLGTFGAVQGNGTIHNSLLLPNVDIEGVAVESDGIIVVGGTGNATGHSNFTLGSFKADGEPWSAGSLTQFTEDGDVVESMLTLANGGIVLVGQSGQLGSYAKQGGRNVFALARLMP